MAVEDSGAPSSTPPKTKEESANSGANNKSDQFIPRADYDALLRRVDGMSAALRRLEESSIQDADDSSRSKKDVKKDSGKEAEENLQEKELQRRVEALENDKKRLKDRQIKALIREAGIAAGVPADNRQKILVAHVVSELGELLHLSDDGESLFVKDANKIDPPKPIKDWMSGFFKVDGAMFLPPIEANNQKISNKNVDPTTGKHKFSSYNQEQLKKAMANDPNEFANFVKNHREDFNRIQFGSF